MIHKEDYAYLRSFRKGFRVYNVMLFNEWYEFLIPTNGNAAPSKILAVNCEDIIHQNISDGTFKRVESDKIVLR